MSVIRAFSFRLAGTALVFAGALTAALAAPVTIVALGTSNTKGRGVPPQQSWPSQLQAMLKSKGVDARIINMGVNGDTSAGMLARLNSIPNGTHLVITEYARSNEDRRQITNTSENMAAIRARLAQRNIKSIEITGVIANEFQRARGQGMLVNDGGPHLNGAAYSEVASQLLSQVMSELGR